MRIITGLARGKKLGTVAGMSTRPTTDRVKESIFNIIQFDIEGRVALDLFCGSGQMGLEAVSRGARLCTFVDSDRRAIAATEGNIAVCGFEERCQLQSGDALAFVGRQKPQSFGLIFLDPPYGGGLLGKALDGIFRFDILQQGGIIVCESDSKDALPQPEAPYRMLKEYIYGRTRIVTFTRDEG